MVCRVGGQRLVAPPGGIFFPGSDEVNAQIFAVGSWTKWLPQNL
jgi:hypothetical protein